MRVFLDQGPEISCRIGISPIHELRSPNARLPHSAGPANYVLLRSTVKPVLMSSLPADVCVSGTILDVSASWAWSAKSLLQLTKAGNAKAPSGLMPTLAVAASGY